MAESKDPKKTVKTAKPIADVAHPGKTPPSETSRSIITHRSLMKDPMVVEDAESTAETETVAETKNPASPKVVTGGERKIQPLADLPVEPAADQEVAKAPKPVADAKDAAEKEAKPEVPAEADTPSPAEGEGEDRGSSDKPEPGQAAAAEEAKQTQHDAEMQKLIETKKYFLPINAVERRRSKRFVALGIVLSLVLAAAWVNIALDAGLIEIDGVKPVTHFFST